MISPNPEIEDLVEPPSVTKKEPEKSINIKDVPLGFAPRSGVAEARTKEFLRRDFFNPNAPENQDLSFVDKIFTAFSNETVLGQAFRDMGGPEYAEDPNFSITDELIEEYAADLSDSTKERLRTPGFFGGGVARNFLEFIHEVNDARITERRRAQLFQGGTLDFIGGLGATILASLPEFIVATAAATTVGSFVSTPVGGVGAGVATATTRIGRIGKIIDVGIKSARGRTVAKTLLTAAAVDVPMELIRYRVDPTIRPIDLAIGISAAGALGGGIAAYKPQWFSAEMRAALRESATELEEEAGAAVASAVAGKPLGAALGVEARQRAKRLQALRELRLEMKKAFDMVDDLARKGRIDELNQMAEQLGVSLKRSRTAEQALKEAEEQTVRQIQNLRGKQARAKLEQMAQDLIEFGAVPFGRPRGIPEGVPTRLSLNELRKSVEKAALKKLRQNPPAADSVPLKVSELKKAIKRAGGARIREESGAIIRKSASEANANQIRKQVARNLSGESISSLKGIAGRLGVFNREAFDGIKAAKKADLRKAREKYLKSQIIEAQVKRLKAKGADFDLDIDDDILNPLMHQRGRSDISPEMQARIDRRRADRDLPTSELGRAAGEAISETGDNSIDDIVQMTTRLAEEAQEGGTRNAIARLIDGEWGEGWTAAKWWHILTTPVSTRLKKTGNAALQTASRLFMESTATGGYNAVQKTRQLQQTAMIQLADAKQRALQAARKVGATIDDSEILSKLRSGATASEMAEHERIYVEGLRDFFANAKKYGQKTGVFRDSLPDSPSYFHRIWRPTQMAKFLNERGEASEEIITFFKEAIEASGDPAMLRVITKGDGSKTTAAEAAARRIVSFMSDKESHGNFKATLRWTASNKSMLIKELGEENTALVDDIINLATDGMHDPVVAAGRPRIKLDENFVGEVNGQQVRVSDFINNNIEEVASIYSQRLFGAGELRKAFKAFVRMHPELFGTTAEKAARENFVPSMDEMISVLQRQSRGTDVEDITEEVMGMTFRSITGLPLWSSSGQKQMRNMIRIQAMGQSTLGMYLGLAQLPEIANIISRSSMRAAFQSFDLQTMTNALLIGVKKNDNIDPILNQLGMHVGVGFDYNIGEHVLRRLDDMGIDGTVRGQTMADRFLDAGRNFSMLNPLGIIPMDTFLRRWATKSNMQWFVDSAYKMNKTGKVDFNSGFWRNSKQRFRELGLDEEMVERINKELLRPEVVQTKKAVFGSHKMIDLNFEAIKDQGAYDALILAMRQLADNQVQRQTIGNLPYWMQMNPLFKVLSQFRVFSFASKGKQLAAGAARGDASEVINMVASAGLGYLSYVGLTYARRPSIDPFEREAWTEERLSMENALKSAVVRSSYSNILPQIIDVAAMTLGSSGDPFFNKYTRTSDTYGLDPIRGSVAWGVGRNVIQSVTGSLQNIIDPNNPWSKEDLRNIQRSVWLSKIPIIDQVINELISQSDLPATDRRY